MREGEFLYGLGACGITTIHLLAEPETRRCASHRADHEPKGHVDLLLQRKTEREKQRGKLRDRLRRRLLPDCIGVFSQKTNLRVRLRSGGSQHGIALGVSAHRHVHVRLTGADPDIADQHIVDILVANVQSARLGVRRERIEIYAPRTLVIGGRRFRLSCE
ncbi:MAG: GNAT family N-acetyltransferase [Verrucomicrobia bacterium]|nr:GNAT family N-acetyltransferase [Verrucomicrobiota bacterium]